MPDLNLIDEGGLEESTSPAPMPSKRKGGGGGGSLNKMLLTVLALLIVGTAVFYLYKKGKFPFKKKAAVTVVQEEPFQEPVPQATENVQQQAVQQPIDTSSVPMLETPMVEDTANQTKMPGAKTAQSKKEGNLVSTSMSSLSSMQGNFTVQVSAFHEKKQADEIMSRLEDAGYPAFVETVPMKGTDWYTVRIGRYPSRTDARKAVQDFALELRSNYWIDRVRSK
jgi:cell division septation protein DedD